MRSTLNRAPDHRARIDWQIREAKEQARSTTITASMRDLCAAFRSGTRDASTKMAIYLRVGGMIRRLDRHVERMRLNPGLRGDDTVTVPSLILRSYRAVKDAPQVEKGAALHVLCWNAGEVFADCPVEEPAQ